MENKKLKIGHLYPDLLNLYGDMGNILTLKNRLLWRGIEAEVVSVAKNDVIDFNELDVIFLGGGSDRENGLVLNLLMKQRKELLEYVESSGVLMAVCGGYQLLGKSFPQNGKQVQGLAVLDVETKVNEKRLIGNVIISSDITGEENLFVGFENHNGRTYLGSCKPFGMVKTGFGNNGEDGICGAIYKNVLGTYLHGPLLPKNPVLADHLLKQAFIRKYGEGMLSALDDQAEKEAHDYAIKRFLKR